MQDDDHLWGATQIQRAFSARPAEMWAWVEDGAPIFIVGRTLHCSRAALFDWLVLHRQAAGTRKQKCVKRKSKA